MRRPTAFATLLFAFSASALADKPITITFLHTNDLHAHVMPTMIRGKSYGGYARLATLIQRERAKKGNLLLLNAGDTFQGTLFFNTYEGLADGAILSSIGPDAGTVGNHEFDKGPDALATFASAISWPLVSANVDFSREPKLRDKIAKSTVVTVGGEKIGIVGATTPETPNISSPGPTIDFKEVVPTVQASIDELTRSGINKIVLVTHIGYREDQEMVARLHDVDLVVGGHSHTPLGTPDLPGWTKSGGPYPTLVKDVAGKTVPIVQAYEWGKVLGKIVIEFDGKGNVKRVKEATPIVVDETIPEDPRIASMAKAFEKPILAIQNAPIGQSSGPIPREPVNEESLMADLIADAMEARLRPLGAVVSFINQGGVRSSFEAGKITYGNAATVMPFNNTFTLLDLTGVELKAALEQGVGTGGQLTPSAGFSYKIDRSAPAGSRVSDVTLDGTPIDPAKIYKVGLLGFTASGGDSHFVLRDAKGTRTDTGLLDIDAFVDYIKAHVPLSLAPDGRVSRAH